MGSPSSPASSVSRPAASLAERRRSARVLVSGRIVAHDALSAEDVTILDMSQGGFLVESDTPFALEAVHRFRIALPNGGWDTLLTAVAVHGHERTATAASPRFVTGFAFVEPRGVDAQLRLAALVDHVTSVQTLVARPD